MKWPAVVVLAALGLSCPIACAGALTLHSLDPAGFEGEDEFAGLRFSFRPIVYSHWLLAMSWSDQGLEKSFRVIFLPGRLENFIAEGMLVQVRDDQLVAISPTDRLMMSSFGDNLRLGAQLPNQDALVQILALLVNPPAAASGAASLCSRRGQWVYGSYTADGPPKFVLAPLGDAATECYGRCGSRCGSSQKYSEVCLSHDLCHRIEGVQMGKCAKEFWAAARSKWSAEVCEGSWR